MIQQIRRSDICRTCVYDKVDEAVLKWVQLIRHKNVPIWGSLIKEQAIRLSEKLGHTYTYIIQKDISGDRVDVSNMECVQWKSTILKAIMEQFQLKEIFTADETELFLPDKTLTCFR
ncbi:Tc5 transposase DNA-binding domain [Popillia japonica]|uniref:Tc5 transposase DNA-binding domain n=1 Tax=Popillia japonica TaxID=7064 RepID=A0AAW1IEC6_POPJA